MANRFFKFNLEQFRDRTARSYGLRRTSYHLRVTNPPETRPTRHANIVREFEEGLTDAIDNLIEDLPDHDRIQLYLSSNRLRSAHTSAPVSVGGWRDTMGVSRQILNQISKMLNSNENFEVDDTLQLDITHVKMPEPGTGKRRWKFGMDNYTELLKKKQSVIVIQNKDELCCARALVTARAKVDNSPEYNNIKRGRESQKTQARELHSQAGVTIGPCGLKEIAQFQAILNDYQIIVISAEHGHSIVYKGPERQKQLMLLMHDAHFDVITSLAGFFSKNYFCLSCERGYFHDNIKEHNCNGKKCFACHQVDCDDFKRKLNEVPEIKCTYCNRRFYGAICQTNHLIRTASGQSADHHKKKSLCQSHKLCSECGKTKNRKHVCGENECLSCKKTVNLQQHKCYIQCSDLDEDAYDDENETHPVFVYFDIEARQDTGNHIANLVCAETDQDGEKHSFYGDTCLEEFLKWVHSVANQEDIEKVIVVAHNFKGYDGYLILEELYRQHVTNLNLIVTGAKILSAQLPNVKFIDSMNFFPMALANFPKTFGLKELKKGFFPHFFNTVENQNYKGPIPDVHYYDPDGMSPSKREEFLKWHESKVKANYMFDFQQELLTYCQSDVRLLKEGCMNFQREFKAMIGFNPMRHCITIASACNVAYRRNWMPENKIAIEPMYGWRPAHIQSMIALEWLYWEENKLKHEEQTPRIAHARNRGERRLKHGAFNDFLVDGYDEQTKTVYEFQGCFYHGCLECFPNRQQNHPKHNNKSMHMVRLQTKQKVEKLQELGYTVIEMWECQWNDLKKNNQDIGNFVSKLKLTTALNPRDAFFGGRTNAIWLHHKVKEDEEIHYMDVTSLYPWANKNMEYPIGHPEFIDQPKTTNIDRYFGVIKCDILPPYELYHPVLPYRQGKKLTFPLCRTCVETESVKPIRERNMHCNHTLEERTLTGTWCTPELNKAIDKGYTIKYIYEVWHFKEKSTDLFRKYIDTFLKLKQEASGWPGECQTEEDRAKYVTDYQKHEKIQLEPQKICKNPGKRQLAKLMLNSFWGKFGQRSNLTQVTTCDKPDLFFQILQDDSQLIHRIEIMNEEMVEIFHSFQQECDPIQINVNIFIACFTTCYARLKLYEALDQLQEQVLYFDTDSVVYVWKPGQTCITVGNYLGEFTSELQEGDHIQEFVAAGPKNYTYVTKNGETCCKVRGFTLNTRGQQVLNFTSMKDLVLMEILEPENETRTLTLNNPHKIVREPATKKIKTVEQDKQYKLVFDKRILDMNTFKSYPYGYKQ